MPLVKAGRLLAVLSVQQSQPRAWTSAEVRLTREAAERTWAVLERARAEAELARSRERLHQAEKSAALGALLAGVSHELNNPLSIITAQASLLQRRPEGPDVAARAGAIAEAAGRCGRIVKTFLAIARQRHMAPAPTDLNAVAAAALELSAYDLRQAGVQVERALDPALPLIRADGDQLRQVLFDLVANAHQAMAGHAGPRRLTLRSGAGADGGVWVEVADTGPGVAEEHRGRIFEPFFTTKPQGGGMGVGLSFAQGLVEAHGGELALADGEEGCDLPGDAAGGRLVQKNLRSFTVTACGPAWAKAALLKLGPCRPSGGEREKPSASVGMPSALRLTCRSPSRSCHAWMAYSPTGTSGRVTVTTPSCARDRARDGAVVGEEGLGPAHVQPHPAVAALHPLDGDHEVGAGGLEGGGGGRRLDGGREEQGGDHGEGPFSGVRRRRGPQTPETSGWGPRVSPAACG